MAKLILVVAGLALSACLVAAQGSAPNELKRRDPQQQDGNTNLDTVTPLTNDNSNELRLPSLQDQDNNRRGQNQNQNNNNQLAPISNESDGEDDSSQFQESSPFPFDPLGIFDPRPRPDRRPQPNRGPGNLFTFFQDPLRHFERHRQMMDQQFRQLEQQLVEGQSTRFFARNGVGYKEVCTTERNGAGYKKVCTIERVGDGSSTDNQQQQQQQNQQQQQQEQEQ